MDRLDLLRSLAIAADTRILFAVIDGLGGLPHPQAGETELEAARTPTLDRLAREGECGLITPVLPGVTPGSGPAHLALFGYDPTVHVIGRGVLGAFGVGIELQPGDVAARINFCTLDDDGRVTDRRASRTGDAVARPLVERLAGITVGDGIAIEVRHEKQYRACVAFRGSGLDGRVGDTDPQATGVEPLPARALHPDAERTAAAAGRFVVAARRGLADAAPANGVLLRGFDSYHPLPGFAELYGLKAMAVASYPMYLGVARLAGMGGTLVGEAPDDLVAGVRAAAAHDFVFMHYKATDSRGEDGDFDAKVREIERADAVIAELAGEFDVIMVTGDHSTPWSMKAHSWHPVPVLIHGGSCRRHAAAGFGERECGQGSLGRLPSMDVLPLVLAHAGRLRKFGA